MKPSTVWTKLRKAYDANKGALLTADDVTCLISMDTAMMELTHPDRESGLPKPPKKPKGRLYYVDGHSGWFVCRTLTARKARMVGVESFGRGGVKFVRLATPAEISECLRWKSLPKDHVFELEEPTS